MGSSLQFWASSEAPKLLKLLNEKQWRRDQHTIAHIKNTTQFIMRSMKKEKIEKMTKRREGEERRQRYTRPLWSWQLGCKNHSIISPLLHFDPPCNSWSLASFLFCRSKLADACLYICCFTVSRAVVGERVGSSLEHE